MAHRINRGSLKLSVLMLEWKPAAHKAGIWICVSILKDLEDQDNQYTFRGCAAVCYNDIFCFQRKNF